LGQEHWTPINSMKWGWKLFAWKWPAEFIVDVLDEAKLEMDH